MAGRRVINRMKLKSYIEMELQKLEDKQAVLLEKGFVDQYYAGWIHALKWVLTKE